MSEPTFTIGEEVEWLTHPTGTMGSGYLHGIVTKIGVSRIQIEIRSPFSGKVKLKWAERHTLRKVSS